MSDLVTIHIEGVPRGSILDALLAIETADSRGVFDDDQHDRLTTLVLGLRAAQDESIQAAWRPDADVL